MTQATGGQRLACTDWCTSRTINHRKTTPKQKKIRQNKVPPMRAPSEVRLRVEFEAISIWKFMRAVPDQIRTAPPFLSPTPPGMLPLGLTAQQLLRIAKLVVAP